MQTIRTYAESTLNVPKERMTSWITAPIYFHFDKLFGVTIVDIFGAALVHSRPADLHTFQSIPVAINVEAKSNNNNE